MCLVLHNQTIIASSKESVLSTSRATNRIQKLAFSILISATLLYIAFQNIDWNRVSEQVQSVPPWCIFGFVTIQFVMFGCRVWRWALLTNPFAPLPFSEHCRITALGVACIVLFPLRLGELVRPILLARESHQPISSGLAATVVERTLDGVFITCVFFLSTAALPKTLSIPASLEHIGWLSLVAFSLAVIGLICFWRWQSQSTTLINRTIGSIAPKLTTRIQNLLNSFHLGLSALPNPTTLLLVLLSSLLFWAVQAFGVHLLMEGLGWKLPAVAPLLITSVVVLAIMAPGGPAFLGTYQTGILLGVSVFGLSGSEAMTLGLIMYPISILVPIVLAIPYLFGTKFSVQELLHYKHRGI